MKYTPIKPDPGVTQLDPIAAGKLETSHPPWRKMGTYGKIIEQNILNGGFECKSLLNLGISNSEKAFNAVARRNRMNQPEHAVTFASAGMCKTMVPTRTS
jgi:hypothetical protein